LLGTRGQSAPADAAGAVDGATGEGPFAPTPDTDAAADDAWFADWRARELSRLDRAGITYVDYTGAALYPESLVRADAARLQHVVLGNPHSEHRPSREATRDADEARWALLDFLHADPAEYAVIFTANASAACRLVAESFPFSAEGAFLATADNHNSVNGMREYARARGAETPVVALDEELRLADVVRHLDAAPRGGALFAFPAQSNFSGVRHPLALVAAARERGWHVLLDAAAFVPTAELRLDQVRPDFVALSLYKIVGYPTGVGALVARHEALATLRRPAFAGGAVDWVSVQGGRHRLAHWPEGFEDGTLPFLALGAVAPALECLGVAGHARLGAHLGRLTSALLEGLAALHHSDGSPVVIVHGPRSGTGRGATIALSVRAPQATGGAPLPYWVVEEGARADSLALRGGCFCNPGCAERAFGFEAARIGACFDELGDSFTIPRLAACLGGASVGALRVSLGLGSVMGDVRRVLEFLGRYAA
jgi:selenocysteine lyase/cysteine desulfurase